MKHQIAEINAQFSERVRLLEMERDEKIRLVQSQCEHEPFIPVDDFDAFFHEAKLIETGAKNICKHCGATLE